MFLNENDDVIQSLISKNAYELRDLLIVDIDSEPYLNSSPCEYYIASVLDEIIRMMTSIIRWEDDFKDGFDKEIVKTHVGNLIIQALYNEINMYHRKFIEALTNLILWKNLNDEKYIRYYYLVKAYNSIQNDINDLEDFYGIRSIKKKKQLDKIEDLLLIESSSIDENKCFFINKYIKPINIKGVPLHLKESSYKHILKKALFLAQDIDKVLLGFTYEHYSYTSSKIHFYTNIDNMNSDMLGDTIRFTMVIMSRIISLCADILCVSNLEQIQNIENIISSLNTSVGWYTPLIKDIYDIDDYVFTLDGKMGRIIEKVTSRYGYKSYKILFLDDNGEGISEDCFPAHEFRRIQPKDMIKKRILDANPLLNELYKKNPDEEFFKSTLDRAFTFLWNHSLKNKYIRK